MKKKIFSDNVGHNILGFFNVLPNFHFTTVKQIVIISNKHGN